MNLSEEVRNEILERAKTQSQYRIERDLHLSAATITRVLWEAGLVECHTSIDCYKDDIIGLLNEGVPIKKIASEYKVTETTVRRFMMLHHVEKPKAPKPEKKEHVFVKPPKPKEAVSHGTHFCNADNRHECYYCSNEGYPMCEYSLIEGKCRLEIVDGEKRVEPASRCTHFITPEEAWSLGKKVREKCRATKKSPY